MKAMIFAAGFGTRLKPITNTKPKALVKFNDLTLLEYAIKKLAFYGVTEIVVNVHHFSEQIIQFVTQNDLGVTIHISDETDELLNTGGGLFNAKEFLKGDEPFFVYNVDIISNIDLSDMLMQHKIKQSLITMAVIDRNTSRYLLFDNEMQLSAWENRTTEERKIIRKQDEYLAYAFSGIQLLSPKVFDLITEKGAFSIIDMYLRLAKDNKMHAFNHTGDFWLDVGKFDQLEDVEKQLQQHTLEFL